MSVLRKALTVSLLALVALGFLWPFFVPTDELADKASWFFLAASPLTLLLVIVLITQEELGSKQIALLGILTALIAALRPLGIGAIGIEPMWFILILSARVFGPSFGFLLGMISMFVSALLTGGIGPWLGYQVFAAAWIGLMAGFLPKAMRGNREIVMLIVYAIFAAQAFGILMDLQFWPWALGSSTQLSYVPSGELAENLSRFITFHFATAMAWDIPRAVFTSALIIFSGKPVLSALRRTHTRASFLAPISFTERVK